MSEVIINVTSIPWSKSERTIRGNH